jgi:hypothetical protein
VVESITTVINKDLRLELGEVVVHPVAIGEGEGHHSSNGEGIQSCTVIDEAVGEGTVLAKAIADEHLKQEVSTRKYFNYVKWKKNRENQRHQIMIINEALPARLKRLVEHRMHPLLKA